MLKKKKCFMAPVKIDVMIQHMYQKLVRLTSHVQVHVSIFKPTKSWTIHNTKISLCFHLLALPCWFLPLYHLICTLLQGRIVTAVTLQWHTIRQKCDVNVRTEAALQNISQSPKIAPRREGRWTRSELKFLIT